MQVEVLPASKGILSIEISPRNVNLPALPSDPMGEEIEKWVDTFFMNRLIQVVLSEQAYLESGRELLRLEKNREKQIEEKENRKIKYHRKMIFYLSNYSLILLFITVSLILGIAVGINIPEGVVCQNSQSPCWWIRIRLKRSL